MAIITKNGFKFFEGIKGQALILETDKLDECLSFCLKEKIKKIAISWAQGFKTDKIDFLKDLHFVEHLSITDANKIKDLTPIYNLKELKYLLINESKHIIDFNKLTSLIELNIDWNNKLKNLHACKQIKILELHKYKPKTKNLHEIADLNNIEELTITQSPITTLEGIEKLRKLKKADFSYLSKLENLSALVALKESLEILLFDYCKKIVNHDTVSQLTSLKTLAFNDCGEIESLGFIESMKKLKNLRFVNTNIKDGNLTPCLSLERVNFNYKKHYSHKPEQLKKT